MALILSTPDGASAAVDRDAAAVCFVMLRDLLSATGGIESGNRVACPVGSGQALAWLSKLCNACASGTPSTVLGVNEPEHGSDAVLQLLDLTHYLEAVEPLRSQVSIAVARLFSTCEPDAVRSLLQVAVVEPPVSSVHS